MRLLPIVTTLACALAGHRASVFGSEPSVAPVLVEMFTSEGCSSCPPADAWLQQLDASQPIPNAQLIVLSEHVDYWNHDGWKDPFSSHILTERQFAYVRALHLREAYTPQMVVDGSSEVQGNDPARVTQVFQMAATATKVSMRITSVSVDGTTHVLRARIEADGGTEMAAADVYAAVALNRAESQVLHGENGGRHLTYVAVLQELAKIGKLEKGKGFRRDFQRKLNPGDDPSNLRIIAFVQESGPGRVLGATLKKAPFQ